MSARRRALARWALAAPLTWLCCPSQGAATNRPPAMPRMHPVLPEAVRQRLESTGLPLPAFGLLVQPVGAALAHAAAPLLALHAELSFQMASTAKLVTALAALDLLGPDHRWLTHARLLGTLREGRLLGDLIIVGGGDPSLRTARLQAWLSELHAQGLHEVWGDIVLDGRAFDLHESDHALTPPLSPDQPGYVRPEALMLDAGVLRVALQAGAAAARVVVHPRQAGLQVINRLAKTGPCHATAELERSAIDARLVVRGQWAADCGEREITQLALTHAELTTRAAAELWRAAGGRLKGRVRAVTAAAGADEMPPTAPWATLASPPLSQLVAVMNKVSDNLVARTLFLSLAEGFPQRAATLAAARARAAAWLRMRGLGEADVALDNGAGLSHAERCRPRALAQLLLHAWHGAHAKAFFASLPVAGLDGTLWRRMTEGPARGRAHLKTGSGIETRSLAGYVRCQSGRVQAFTAFVNHPQAADTVPALDAVVEWVVLNG